MEAAASQRERSDRCERFQLFRRIGAQMDVGALKAGVAKKERDLANVACRLQRVHCAGVAKDVGRNAFFGDRRLLFRRYRNMLGEDVLESGTRHGAPSSIGEQLRAAVLWTDRKPSPQGRRCLLPERQDALASPLAHDMDAGTSLTVEVIQAKTD